MNAKKKPVIWTAQEVADALGLAMKTSWSATGVSIDSRSVAVGDLFIAITGPAHDGHRFVVEALEKGAVGAIIHCDPGQLTEDSGLADRMIEVADTLVGMQQLAAHARERSAARIIAVTGSVGKTGSKEILKLLLSDQGRTAATEGNLNNHWGLPLSLARMPKDTEFGIFEMGMNHVGEIRPLSLIASPDVSLITTVEMVHSEFFDSVEQIAESKAEIFAGFKSDSVAVLNIDNPMFDILKTIAGRSGAQTVRTFGCHQDADFRLILAESGNTHCRVQANIHARPVSFEIGMPGKHWALNAMGVLACIEAVGANVEQAIARLKDMHGLKGRGEFHEVKIDGGRFVLVDESYNASPISMTAAIETLGQMSVSGKGRRIVVLGDMLELGDEAEKCHGNLINPLLKSGIDLVFTAGQYMARLWDALPADMRGGHAMTSQNLSPLVTSAVRPDDIVMVKGSLGSKTGMIVDDLLEAGHRNGRVESKIVNGN